MNQSNTFHFPTTGLRVANRVTLLSVDDESLPLRRELCYRMTKPDVRPEPVLRGDRDNPDAVDNEAAHFYGTVLQDEGKFRMWYYACHRGMNPDWPDGTAEQLPTWDEGDHCMGPLCYAESEDGICWTKPNLGQVKFKGSTSNNALKLPHIRVACAHVIRDDEDLDPARLYKMAYWYQDMRFEPGRPTFATAVSPDGLDWTVNNLRPTAMFLEAGSFYKHDGYYIVNGQSGDPFVRSEGDAKKGRVGVVMISRDFENWLQEYGESFALPEPLNRDDRGYKMPYDQVHLGTGAASYGNALVGLYARWYNSDSFNEISADFGLVVSSDGISFQEPEKGYIYLAAADSPAAPVPGKNYKTILCQGNGILNVGDETRIYHGRWRNCHDPKLNQATEDYDGCVALATIPRDRWAGLMLYRRPGRGLEGHGAAWTCPITLPSGDWSLTLNAEGADGISVEVADAHFELMPEFSAENSGIPAADEGFDVPVNWSDADTKKLQGKTVRFRFNLIRSDKVEPVLFAVYLNV